MTALEPIPPHPSLTLQVLASLVTAGCLFFVGTGISFFVDDLDGGGFFGGLLATTFGWFALLQYLAIYRRHAAAAGVIGAALGCFGVLAGIVAGFIIADEPLGTSLDRREFFRLTGALVVAALLACSSYLNLKWQAKVLEAQKSDKPPQADWQFSFRELILGVSALAAVLGVAMWQAKDRQ